MSLRLESQQGGVPGIHRQAVDHRFLEALRPPVLGVGPKRFVEGLVHRHDRQLVRHCVPVLRSGHEHRFLGWQRRRQHPVLRDHGRGALHTLPQPVPLRESPGKITYIEG